MKKLLLLFAFVFLATACSLDSDDGTKNDFTIQYLGVDSVDMPDFVTPGKSYSLKLYYHRPSTCYYINNNFYTAVGESSLTVAIESVLIEDANCMAPSYNAAEFVTFNFECPLSQIGETYTFKFFKGSDDYGKQQFMEVKVPVHL